MEMLDTVAKAPVQIVWDWVNTSIQGILETPSFLGKGFQSLISLVATVLLIPAVSWFIAVKATQVTVTVTATAINITASAAKP